VPVSVGLDKAKSFMPSVLKPSVGFAAPVSLP
jgi:hypothetical protein